MATSPKTRKGRIFRRQPRKLSLKAFRTGTSFSATRLGAKNMAIVSGIPSNSAMRTGRASIGLIAINESRLSGSMVAASIVIPVGARIATKMTDHDQPDPNRKQQINQAHQGERPWFVRDPGEQLTDG